MESVSTTPAQSPSGSFCLVESAGSRGDDVCSIVKRPPRTLVVVADGAGGQGGGRRAAELAVARACEVFDGPYPPRDVYEWLVFTTSLDEELCGDGDAGLTTLALFAIAGGEISGVLVGDSEAALLSRASAPSPRWEQLAATHRRPLLGSGEAMPTPVLGRSFRRKRLLVASDGLWHYTAPRDLRCLAQAEMEPEALTRRLVDAARLPSGALQDDIAVAVVDAP